MTSSGVINRYTELTGRPFMPPIYGLEMGDADCYLHSPRHGEIHTLDSLEVADDYLKHDIPLGWMLVNDGYGCGYEFLDQVAAGLDARNMQLGLWTSTGLGSHAAEVRAGVRVRKLDIGWVGPGYRAALSACEEAYKGMERDTDIRGFVWLPEGWAGSQRCGVHWSGDQKGNWETIRWQIPTYAGSTMSGQAYTTSDVDGIFEGSAQTYLRDLQWKTFLPTGIAMNGWSVRHKRPWRDGEPFTSANRSSFHLRERLLPYQYTYAAQAHRTGVGPVRPLVLEYPDDPQTWGEAVKYEFLSGEAFLVAPVYSRHDRPQRHLSPPGPVDGLLVGAGLRRAAHAQRVPRPARQAAAVREGRIDHPDVAGGHPVMADPGPQPARPRHLSRRGRLVHPLRGRRCQPRLQPAGSTPSRPSPLLRPPPASRSGSARAWGATPARLTAGDTASRSTTSGVRRGVAFGDTVLPRYDDPAAYAAAATGWYRDPARAGMTDIKLPLLAADAAATVTLRR